MCDNVRIPCCSLPPDTFPDGQHGVLGQGGLPADAGHGPHHKGLHTCKQTMVISVLNSSVSSRIQPFPPTSIILGTKSYSLKALASFNSEL